MVFLGSECCYFQQSCSNEIAGMPCLMFWLQDMCDIHLENTSHILADMIFPVLLETIIKGIIHYSCLVLHDFFFLKFHEFCYVPVYEHGRVCDFTSKLVIVRLRCMQPVFCFSFLIQIHYHDFVLKLIIYILVNKNDFFLLLICNNCAG